MGVLRERVVAVLLGEAGRHAHPVLAVGTQDLHLVPRQSREDHEAVQRVDLGLPTPHRGERLAHQVGLRLEVQHGAARVEHAEVVDVDLALALDGDGHLFDGPQTERLEERHERGQVDLAAGLVELDPREALAGRLVGDPDHEAVDRGPQALQHRDVDAHLFPVGLDHLVVVGEPGSVLGGEDGPALGSEDLDQVVEEVVLPGAGELLDLGLELFVGDLRDLRARLHVDREEDAGGLGLAERQVVVDRRAVEPRHEHLLQAAAERPAELLARQRDDDRDLAPVQILANQDADPAVLLELQQADDEPAELLGRAPGTARHEGRTRRARRPPCSRANRGSGPRP